MRHLTKRTHIILIMLGILIAVRFIASNPTSTDSWLHIGVGKFIVQNNHIPSHKDISYKNVEPSLEYIDHSWLSDILIYEAQTILGPSGLFLLPTAVFLASLFLLSKVLTLLDITSYSTGIAVSFASFLTIPYWKLHPFIFLPLLGLSLIYVYLKWRTGNQKILYLFPLIVCAWANLIGGYIAIAGCMLIGMIGYESFLRIINRFDHKTIKKQKGNLSGLVIWSFLSFVASLMNPLFLRIWIYALTVLAILLSPIKIFSSLGGILSTINQSFVRDAPATLFYILFLLYLLMSLFVFIILLVKKRLSFVNHILIAIPWLPFFALPFMWIKFIPLTVFLTSPFLALEIDYIIHPANKHQSLFKIAIAAFIFMILGTFIVHPPVTKSILVPKKQLEFIRTYNLPKNVFSTYDLTSYSFYADYPSKKFIDAQDDFYDDSDVLGYYLYNEIIPKKAFETIVNTNKISTVLTSNSIGGLGSNLSRDPEWLLVYLDRAGYVFVKKKSVSKQFISEYGLQYIDLSNSFGFKRDSISSAEAELAAFTRRFPDDTLALGELSTIYRVQKKYRQAEEVLNRIPAQDRDYIVYTEMGRLKAAQGLCRSSEEMYLKALDDKKEQDFSRAVLDLAIVYAGCLNEREKAKHYFLRYNSYVLPPAERIRLDKIIKEFGISLQDDF